MGQPAQCSGRALLLGVVLLLVPLATSALMLVLVVGDDHLPAGDRASIELRTSDVGSHEVLTGLYSREGWNHPGPALFYLLAAPYRLSGSSSIAIPVVALAVNAAALAGMVLIAARRGGVSLALCTLIGGALLVRSLGPDFLRDGWNPYLPVLPFGLLLFLVWALVSGDAWSLPVATAVASFVAQTHVGFVPLALPLLALGAGWLVVRRRSELRRLAVPVALSVAVAATLWLPPIVDELVNQPGNLAEIATYFREEGGESRTLAEGLRIVGAQFEAAPEWVTGVRSANAFSGEPKTLDSPVVPLLLVAFIAAAIVAWRRAAWGPLTLIVVVSAALVLGMLSVARTIGPLYSYRLRWTMVLGAIAAVAVAWVIWTAVGRASRAAVVVSSAALAALTVSSTVAAVRDEVPRPVFTTALSDLVGPTRAALRSSEGTVLVRSDEVFNEYGLGVLLALERASIDAKLDDVEANADGLGRHRIHRGGPVGAVVDVETKGLDTRLQDGERPVAYHGPQPLGERSALLERAAALDSRFASGRLDEVEYYMQRADLTERLGAAVGVFVDEGDTPRHVSR